MLCEASTDIQAANIFCLHEACHACAASKQGPLAKEGVAAQHRGLYLTDGATCTEGRQLIALLICPFQRLQSPFPQRHGRVLKEGSISCQGLSYVLVYGPRGGPVHFPDGLMW